MKKSVCLSQDSNLGSQIYLYGLIQPIRGRNRVKGPSINYVVSKLAICALCDILIPYLCIYLCG